MEVEYLNLRRAVHQLRHKLLQQRATVTVANLHED
jgi:hypothetical protein